MDFSICNDHTLIDNIFTNVMEDRTVSGLIVNEISDHLLVFVIYECSYGKDGDDNRVNYKRVKT